MKRATANVDTHAQISGAHTDVVRCRCEKKVRRQLRRALTEEVAHGVLLSESYLVIGDLRRTNEIVTDLEVPPR